MKRLVGLPGRGDRWVATTEEHELDTAFRHGATIGILALFAVSAVALYAAIASASRTQLGVMFILFIWVAFVVGYVGAFLLIARLIAQPKGRSAAWGLLGVFGLIILALLPARTGTGVWEECPECREPIKVGAVVCASCQSELEWG